MSRLHRLKQNHPLDVAIYHIEYVIETDGAHNLRAQSHNLVWYQYFMLDSILLIFTTIAGAIFLQRLVCQEKIQFKCIGAHTLDLSLRVVQNDLIFNRSLVDLEI